MAGRENFRWKAVAGTALAALSFAVLIALVGILTDFHAPLNDFWGNWHLARKLDLHDPDTLYDGFFPVGYTALLRGLAGAGFPAQAAVGINVLLTWLLALAVLGWLRRRGLGGFACIIAAVAVFLFPKVFDYLYTPGADAGAMVFFTLGSYALLLALMAPLPHAWWYVPTGGLLGTAALWRYHALLGAVCLLVAATIVYRKRVAGIALALASCGAVYGCQIAVNLRSGHSPFQTYQAFNIYQHMHPVNWYHTASMSSLGTPWSVILAAPSAFLSSYLTTFVWLFPALSAPLVLCFIAKDHQLRRAALAWLCFCLLYSGLMAAGDSGRAVLLALPVSLSLLAVSVNALWVERFPTLSTTRPWLRPVAAALMALCLAACATSDIASVVSWGKISRHYRALEKVCLREGITDAGQVYSTDINLVFPGIPSFHPSYSGGWLDLPMYHAKGEAHGPSLASEGAFIRDCKARGIQMVHLTPSCKRAAAFLYRIYSSPDSAKSVRLVAEIGRSRLFRLE